MSATAGMGILTNLKALLADYEHKEARLLTWQDFIRYMQERGGLQKRDVTWLYENKLISYDDYRFMRQTIEKREQKQA